MVDLNELRPRWRDVFDVGAGILLDRFVIRRLQQYASLQMKSSIQNAVSEVYSQQKTEREELYKKIDSLTYEIAEMKKKVGTS